jgi:hypothetical protein
METSPLTCVYCGGAIDLYEPVVLVEHDGERETSLAREPDLAGRGRVLMIHSRCAPVGWRTASA